MSNYTQVTFFAPKDALLSGNPAKLIKGADVDPELAAISVAIASKFDGTNFLAANPGAAIGLTTVNGVATTWMRSDAAPALDQTIAPTMTGNWTYTPGSGTGVTINGKAGGAVIAMNSASTASSNDIQLIRTTSTANAQGVGPNLLLLDTSGGVLGTMLQHSGGQTELWQFNGAWNQIMRFTTGLAIQGRGPVAAAPVDMTPDASTFTGAATGFTAGVNYACTWYRIGKRVILTITSGAGGTSNSTSFTMTGLPASIQPTTGGNRMGPLNGMQVFDNGALTALASIVEYSISGGTVTFYKGGVAAGWTAANVKGLNVSSITLDYPLY